LISDAIDAESMIYERRFDVFFAMRHLLYYLFSLMPLSFRFITLCRFFLDAAL